MQPNHVDEEYIDLLGVLRIVWQGKWIVIGVTVASLLASFVYLANLPSKYTLRVPFDTHLYSIEALNFCGNNTACLQAETKSMLLSGSNTGWSIGKGPAFVRIVSDISASESYVAELEQLKDSAKQLVTASVEREIDVLEKQIPQALVTTETFTKHMLVATRLRAALVEEKTEIFTLGKTDIRSVHPSNWVIVTVALIVGLLSGLVLAFLRHFIRTVALGLRTE